MFLLGLFIGAVLGMIAGILITQAPPAKEKTENYEYDYSDPATRSEGNPHYYYGIKDDKGIDSEWLKPDPYAEPNNLFYGKKVVFTGNLAHIERNDAAMYVAKLGGDVNQSLSKKTDMVIIGENPGPSKMQQIVQLNKVRNTPIELIGEDGFLSMIREYLDISVILTPQIGHIDPPGERDSKNAVA
jgi:NAD-dependent DNA ligase